MRDMLGYLLKLDEPDERARIEEHLRNNPAASVQMAVLKRMLLPLVADRPAPTPPEDLVARTIVRVAKHICAKEQSARDDAEIEELVSRMSASRWRQVVASLDSIPRSSRWRRSDMAVAACVVAIAFAVLLAALPFVRQRHNQFACQNHMRQLYQALDTYAEAHQGQFPLVSEEPNNLTSSFISVLREAGSLPPDDDLRCPAAGPNAFASYAYTLGYRDAAGGLRGLNRSISEPSFDLLPIVADRPALGRRSPNPDHEVGQNVLFGGGNARFCTTNHVGIDGDDIYRNKLGKVGAGLSIFDSALGVTGDRP